MSRPYGVDRRPNKQVSPHPSGQVGFGQLLLRAGEDLVGMTELHQFAQPEESREVRGARRLLHIMCHDDDCNIFDNFPNQLFNSVSGNRVQRRCRLVHQNDFGLDGNDAREVYRETLQAVGRARRGEGPTLIEASTYRHGGHHVNDPGLYMDPQTLAAWLDTLRGIYPDEDVKFYFAGIDKARFRRPIVPGDQLLLKVVLERRIRTIWKFSTVAEVAGQEACSAEMMVMPG